MPEHQEPPASSRAMPPKAEVGYPRPYANSQLNARLVTALPDGRWGVRWRVDLDPFFPYAFVLQVGNRIMLQGANRWQLLDQQGTSISTGNYGDSEIVLDYERRLIYMVDGVGRGLALRLDDTEPAFIVPFEGTDDDRRTFLARQDNVMVVTSSRRPTNPHDPNPLLFSTAATYHLGNSLDISEGILISARRTGLLSYYVDRMLAALHRETLVIAIQDRLLRTDLNLNVQAELEDAFTPLAMSLDETGRVYLVVRTETEEGGVRYALWVLSPQGKRVIDLEIPAHPAGVYTPPIVGYAHQVYLLLGNQVMAISPKGEVRWREQAGGSIAGAVVTADDRLLVAAGGLLTAFEATGERTTLFFQEEGTWTTPPVLTERNRILVATERHLYCLELNN